MSNLSKMQSDFLTVLPFTQFHPLWNVAIDGFGNHDPGKGRYEQAKSDWDVIHPGRTWAARCNGIPKAESIILDNIDRHFQTIGGQI